MPLIALATLSKGTMEDVAKDYANDKTCFFFLSPLKEGEEHLFLVLRVLS